VVLEKGGEVWGQPQLQQRQDDALFTTAVRLLRHNVAVKSNFSPTEMCGFVLEKHQFC
jgi:hypothetical protein